jgi:NagD protein
LRARYWQDERRPRSPDQLPHGHGRRAGPRGAPHPLWTSALATAKFLDSQRPGGGALAVGEAGLTTALHDPDYVVLGETRTYSFELITKAIRLIERGARFIATNPDPVGPSLEGSLPATGSVAALITKATGVHPYDVGKPNPLMTRSALRAIGTHSETTVMIGDRMDTDIVAGMETVLVLTGISTWAWAASAERYTVPGRGHGKRRPGTVPAA